MMYRNTSSGDDSEHLLVDYGQNIIARWPRLSASSRLTAGSNDSKTLWSDNATLSLLNTVADGLFDSRSPYNAGSMWSDAASYAFGALSLGIASVGVILNIAVIFSIIHNRQLRSQVANVLICNLAFGSLVACVIMLTVEVPVRLLSRTTIATYQQPTCDTIGFVTSALTVGTIWTVVALSVDKCRSIDSPLRHSYLATRIKMLVHFFWIWATALLLAAFPMLFGGRYVFQPAEGTCDMEYERNARWWYALLYLVVTHYIPGFIVCFCHWRIFAIARIQSRRMATMVHLVTLIQVPLLNGRMAAQHLSPQGRKAIYTTSIFVGTFILCYLPHALVCTSRLFCALFSDQIVVSMATLLQRSAFAVNIFIYGCRNRMVRDSFAKYVRRKLLEHASALQWKRERRRSSVHSIVRVDRPNAAGRKSSEYRPMALCPARSHPNLSKAYCSPLVPRAISLDIDLNELSSPSRRRPLCSVSCRQLDETTWQGPEAPSDCRSDQRRRTLADSRPLLEEKAVVNENHSSSAADANERSACDRAESTYVCVPDQTEVDVHKGPSTPNGVCPISSHQTSLVTMKESVV